MYVQDTSTGIRHSRSWLLRFDFLPSARPIRQSTDAGGRRLNLGAHSFHKRTSRWCVVRIKRLALSSMRFRTSCLKVLCARPKKWKLQAYRWRERALLVVVWSAFVWPPNHSRSFSFLFMLMCFAVMPGIGKSKVWCHCEGVSHMVFSFFSFSSLFYTRMTKNQSTPCRRSERDASLRVRSH